MSTNLTIVAFGHTGANAVDLHFLLPALLDFPPLPLLGPLTIILLLFGLWAVRIF